MTDDPYCIHEHRIRALCCGCGEWLDDPEELEVETARLKQLNAALLDLLKVVVARLEVDQMEGGIGKAWIIGARAAIAKAEKGGEH